MMTEIPKVRFVLAVLDLRRSTAWYTSVLGLTIDFEAPGWSFLSRGSFRVMLGECADAIQPWGMREFGIRTIDGHQLMFGQKL